MISIKRGTVYKLYNVARFRSLARLDQLSSRIRNFSEPYRDWLKGLEFTAWNSLELLESTVAKWRNGREKLSFYFRSGDDSVSGMSIVADIFFKRLLLNEIINDTSNLLFARHTFAQAKKKKNSKMIGSMSHDLYDRVIWFTCSWGYFSTEFDGSMIVQKNLFTSMSKKNQRFVIPLGTNKSPFRQSTGGCFTQTESNLIYSHARRTLHRPLDALFITCAEMDEIDTNEAPHNNRMLSARKFYHHKIVSIA